MKKTLPMRLLAVVACVAMLVTVIPIFAAAETIITEIVITNADMTPVIGKPAGNYLAYTLPDDAPYVCLHHYWYNDTKGFMLKEDDVFVEGDLYSLEWSISPKDGYAFSSATTLSLNGGEGSIDYENTVVVEYDCGIWSERTEAVTALPIKSILITDVDGTPVVGERASNNVSYTLPDNAHFTCTDCYWYSITKRVPLSENEFFTKEDVYCLVWEIVPDDGYTFYNGYLPIYIYNVNGAAKGIAGDTNVAGDSGIIYSGIFYPSDQPAISEIHLFDVDLTPVAGERAGDHLTYALPDDAPYTCTHQFWFNDSKGTSLSEDDLFEAGDSYSLAWMLEPREGHTFSSAVDISLNGSEEGIDRADTLIGETQCTVWTQPVSAVVPPISEIRLTDAEFTPVADEMAGDHLSYTLPDGAQYTCTEHYWYNNSEGVSLGEDDSFVGGNSYSLRWVLVPNEGYTFDTGANISLNDGTENIDAENTSVAEDRCVISTTPMEALAATVITEINLIYPDVPVAGAIVGDYMKPTLADGAHCYCGACWWEDVSQGFEPGASDAFVEGDAYITRLILWTDEGYTFADDTKILVNGKEGRINYDYTWFSGNMCNIWTIPVETIPPTLISEINLTDVEVAPVVGERAGDHLKLTLPDNAPYTCKEYFWYGDSESVQLEENDIFAAGKTYSIKWLIVPNAGYAFADDVKILINGTEGKIDEANTVCSRNACGIWSKPVETPPPTIISEINLTDVDVTPILDEKAGDLLHVTLPENCGYTVYAHCWFEDGGVMDADKTFAEGSRYAVCITLKAEPEYAFAEDAVVTVNGSAEKIDADYGGYYNAQEFDIWTIYSEPQPVFDLESGIHLMVGKTWVNTKNAADVLHNGCVSYDDATKTLTLKNLTVLGCSYVEDAEAYCTIYADQFITINLLGNSMVHQGVATQDKTCCGIYICGSGDCPPLLTGDGGLAVYAGDTTSGNSTAIFESADNVEIAATGNLFFQAGICGETGDSNPISCPGNVLFSGLNVRHNLSLVSGKEIDVQCAFLCDVKATMFTVDEYESVEAPAECFEKKDGVTYFRSGEGYTEVDFSFREAVIDTIEINGSSHAIIDGKASDNPGFTVPEGAPYHFEPDSVYWMNDTDGVKMNGDDTFEKGKLYSVGGYLVADEEYVFAAKPTILLNGGKLITFKERTKIDGTNEHRFSVWGQSREAAVGIIDTVEIDGFSVPIAGDKAGDYINLTIPEGAHYAFVPGSLCWTNYTDVIDVDDYATFEKGKFYALGGTLIADEGYAFTENPTVLLNGGKFDIDEEYTYVKGTDDRYFYVSGISKEAVDPTELGKVKVDLRIGDKEFYGVEGNETLIVESLDDVQNITVLTQNGVDIEGMSDDWSMSTKFLDSEGRGVLEVQVFEEGNGYITFNLQSHYADCPGANVDDFQIMLITVKLPAAALLGDVNGDGAVNMKDVLLMRKYLAGMDVEYDAQNADCNGDGDVNMKDVLMLRKFLAGLIEKLGA